MTEVDKIFRKQVEAINNHFLENEVMTEKEYSEISTSLIEGLIDEARIKKND